MTATTTERTRTARGAPVVVGFLGVTLWTLLLPTMTAVAQGGQAAPAGTPQRPRVGLVLGGGGAKGAAHIGVLRVLDELRVPVDCIAGTSMGALIGGTFASGMPAEDIERAVLGINWSRTVGTEGLRDRTPIERKLAGITYTNGIEFGIKGGSLTAPGGLLKTQDIEDVIRGLVSDARFTRDFNDLPIPFRAVATDMLAGEMVVLDRGDLSVAMRASMAVPGAFSPVVVEGKVLSDGGMMRNLPVDIARGLCADVVIAVWLASPPPQAGDLESAVALATRSLDVMIDANQKAQIATLGERDVGIVVPMGDIGSADFDKVPKAIPLGRAAAEGVREQLARYSLPEADYLAWRSAVTQQDGAIVRVAEVRIEGLRRVNPEFVRANLRNARPGAELTTKQVVEDTGRIFALGDFERVEYGYSGPRESGTLHISAVEKSWGPDFVRFDLGLAGAGNGTLQSILRADHERTWVDSYGAQWRNTLQLGQQTLLKTTFYQPLDIRQRFFVEPLAAFERNLEDIYVDGERIARYELREIFGQVDFGINIGTRAQLRTGVRSGWVSADIDTGPRIFPESDREGDTAYVARLVYDTRDAVGLQTRGTLINMRYANSDSWLGGEQEYSLAEGVIVTALSFRGDAMTLALGGGKELSGDLSITEEFQLGGVRSFPGLQRAELRGDSYWYGTTQYWWKLGDIQSLFGQALYAGLRLQAGRMGGRVDSFAEDDGTLYGAAISLGGRTPIGPFILSIGVVDNSAWQVQFGVGRPIPEGSILDEIR
ncbi:MAG: patatin-like phospholipase family protein [Gammaproteobacteria bacterium]|nr:patatin-like phospholipase family protein [Gammaproteobacteria bacterium]